MTSNLTKLFEEAEREGRQPEHTRHAIGRRDDLLANHGRAMVEALEALACTHHTPDTLTRALDGAKALLAQLETEAQP